VDLLRTGGPYREGRAGARTRPYILIDPAEIFVVRCHAAHQGSLIVPHPDGVLRATQALLGKAFLSVRLFLHHFWKCDRRRQQLVSGITFLQTMPLASTRGSSVYRAGFLTSGYNHAWEDHGGVSADCVFSRERC